ncbi:hypothetical protein K431DRAFT_290643 [Polychaeton citri CBS 116435]|uniref:Meiotically up-regulated gene 190 protein n=1 Tax=Polychaeton citri CBS 116435 TaxID=1314669 RepID=A0A9P4UU81_9PEZI|nr:hypothetical protein K431DRAFT_290643 [Polychaeton citri CBS 116435]
MSGADDADESRRRYQAPYTGRHTIPTIAKFREEKAARQAEALDAEEADDDSGNVSPQELDQTKSSGSQDADDGKASAPRDTSEADPSAADPKQRRKNLKKHDRERAEREVTDPVTHLPVRIHDFTDKALEQLDENDPPYGSTKHTATGLSGKSKSSQELHDEADDMEYEHRDLQKLFPPPDFDALRLELANINKLGISVGLGGVAIIVALAFAVERLTSLSPLSAATGKQAGVRNCVVYGVWVLIFALSVGASWALILGVRDWVARKIDDVFQDEVWDAQRQETREEASKHKTETTLWLNSLLSSVWPLINPDLFTSLADTLEDVMQASLPRFVRMVSVDDIGQGSESLRILGVKWLPTGAAARSVKADGKLAARDQDKLHNFRAIEGKGNNSSGDEADHNAESDEKETKQGMEAEEGDFVNLEVAFAYRARSSTKTFKDRTKDMHLYLAFYLPGNIKLPIWVDLRGIIGTMRMRLQLTPDPPFFALCTITFLGQPRVTLSCVPLSKHGLNLMDIPLISNFVQSAVDAAMAEYVAPKSLTLDLKDMLAGDDFKKDTVARGVLVVNIRRGYDFKVGDTGIPMIKDGSSDPYVSVGWAKFGKPVWSTRVLLNEMEPHWDETAFVLVTPEELNVDEKLRVQLWDSDRLTADDDLGRIEVNLKSLMKDEQSNGKMWKRSDGFRALKAGENMPGKLEWSVGYYSKTRLQRCQLDRQTFDPDIRSMDQLKKKVDEVCERKLRETMLKGGKGNRDQDEFEQQKMQELKSREDAMITSAPPPDGFPSGIFSIQVHQITGLELEKLSKGNAEKDNEASDEEEEGEGLPSSYCTIIINHKKVFKTRTKPQNAKPFFNAGCERFIRDWREAEIHVSVRDARVHEDDPLLGVVYLPLKEIFENRSQVNGFWPLTGGVGYGRIRLSMVWRSVQLQAPPSMLGWEYGTVEISPTATSSDCPQDLEGAKLKIRTNISTGKMYAERNEQRWATSKSRSLKLAVQGRYSSCMTIAFKQSALMGQKVTAFSILWLKDIPDEEEQELTLPIWKGDFARARACCLEEYGEKVGTITLKLTFWAGMGMAHSRWASKDENLKNVVEILDTARDNLEEEETARKAGIVDEDVSSSSDEEEDSDSSDNNEASKHSKVHGKKTNGMKGDASLSDNDKDSKHDSDVPDGSEGHRQGLVDQMRSYKKHEKGLHRRNRGLMQWKVPRTAKWMKHKLDKVEDGITGAFEHKGRQPGIETEV